jgi:mannose-6-phosphate isomerase-like protein (cupin superfamily)
MSMTTPTYLVENPVTGERAIFPRTTAEGTADVLRFDLFVRPGGFVVGANEHIHPQQDEYFQVKAGTLRLRMAGSERNYAIGEETTVPAGTPHVWWNAGADELHAIVELRGKSAGRFILPITSFFALAQAGKTNEKGDPNLLQSAVILFEYRDVLCAAPLLVQKVIVPPLALLGRLMRYRADYPYPNLPLTG